MLRGSLVAASLAIFLMQTANAAVEPGRGLVDRLDDLRTRIIDLEQSVLTTFKGEKQAKANIKKLQALMKLRQEERALGVKRLAELETTVRELESRREVLGQRIRENQKIVATFLKSVEKAAREEQLQNAANDSMRLTDREKLESARRKVMANLAGRGLKEIEVMRVDLADADHLGVRIQEEKQELANLFQDLDEKEGLLELNRQLQVDLVRKNHDERLAQLQNYNRLKTAEAQVERLLKDFNARLELERATEAERVASRAMSHGVFAKLQGRLPFPITGGKVLSTFGKAYDAKSRLYVFRKGIDIAAGKNSPVRAISAGKIAYSGELPNYGQVTIIDHGDQFYSLCAHLGALSKKAGEPVAAGDAIGATDESGTPVYFEIRMRNVAVNPLQWISN